ncbi:hypothetical protein ACHQM5_006309 [Ranunculus cassubicifolius]
MQQQNMDLILSSDSKPRLKWTPVLHKRFIEAVAHLGGPERATPKSLMRVMRIPGLTLFHLKSHLQKYRLGKNQQSETFRGNEQEQESEVEEGTTGDGTYTQIDENLHITQALEMQMEVQNKLHDQIEVQRHLQLRIEAQGMYLQSILKKAQDTLAGYNSGLHLTCSFSSDSCLTCPEANVSNVGSCYRLAGRKRSGSTMSDESCVEQLELEIAPPEQEKPLKVRRELDLNSCDPELLDEC